MTEKYLPPSKAEKRIALPPAGPDREFGPLVLQLDRQFFDCESLRGIVSRQDHTDPVSLSRQAIVETHLTRQQHIRACSNRIREKLAA